MMAGAALYAVRPSSIWMHLGVIAVIDFTFFMKEVWTMNKTDVGREVNSWFQSVKNRIIGSGARLLSRPSLLTSL